MSENLLQPNGWDEPELEEADIALAEERVYVQELLRRFRECGKEVQYHPVNLRLVEKVSKGKS